MPEINSLLNDFVQQNPRYSNSMMEIILTGHEILTKLRRQNHKQHSLHYDFFSLYGFLMTDGTIIMDRQPMKAYGDYHHIEDSLQKFMHKNGISAELTEAVNHHLQKAMIINISNNPIRKNSPGLLYAHALYVQQELFIHPTQRQYPPHLIYKAARRLDQNLRQELEANLRQKIQAHLLLTTNLKDFMKSTTNDKKNLLQYPAIMFRPDFFIFSTIPFHSDSSNTYTGVTNLSLIRYIKDYVQENEYLRDILFKFYDDLISQSKAFLISTGINTNPDRKSMYNLGQGSGYRVLPNYILPNGHSGRQDDKTMRVIVDSLNHQYTDSPSSL